MSGSAGAGARPAEVVLIVDDVPDNVSVLHDALDAAGYVVLVALDGASALRRVAQAHPDVVLLDALMPGMDGFAVARRLKADPETAHIPIVFMTGLTETEHVVAAFAAGGIDYVTKPIRPAEVLVRIAAHMAGARASRQARTALDAHGQATLAVRAGTPPGPAWRIVWQTPLARELLGRYVPGPPDRGDALAEPLVEWMNRATAPADPADGRAAGEAMPFTVPDASASGRRLVLGLQQRTPDGDCLVVMREVSDTAVLDALVRAFRLTLREAEVLYWVTKGKTNRDIGDILGSSPATVKKQLEHVYVKLGVETRTAAAGMALGKINAARPGGR